MIIFIRFLYSIIFCLLVPLMVIRGFFQYFDTKLFWINIFKRFGFFYFKKKNIWIHAVSLGEVIAVIPFIKYFLEKYSNYNIVITTSTFAGTCKVYQEFKSNVNVFHVKIKFKSVSTQQDEN